MPSKKGRKNYISVIIPAYNAGGALRACLDALLVQTILPNEVIVVNDGSADDTVRVAESYSSVVLLSQSNQGPAKARNEGARHAKGDIIVFLDSDCVPEKDWLEEMIKPFGKGNVVGVQGAYKSKQTNMVSRFDQIDIEYRYERMKRSAKLDWIGSYSAAYRKNIFLDEKGFDETFPRASGEDAEFSYRLSEKGHLLVFNPSAIVYHTHPESFWGFLNIEYFRAYWRMRMYVKHPLKAVRDSYTPHSLKGSVAAGAALLVGAVFSLLIFTLQFHRFPNVISLINIGFAAGFLAILVFNLLFLFFVLNKDAPIALFSVVMVELRAIVFGIGVIRGFFDEKVRA